MNPMSRLASIALVAVVAIGTAYFVLKAPSGVGAPQATPPTAAPSSSPTPSVEGTWKTSFTHEEMIAAGLVDQAEDDPSNWGTFVLTLREGRFTTVQQDLNGEVVSGTYTFDGTTITMAPSNEPGVHFVMPLAVDPNVLNFGKGGPVTYRVKPWFRLSP